MIQIRVFTKFKKRKLTVAVDAMASLILTLDAIVYKINDSDGETLQRDREKMIVE